MSSGPEKIVAVTGGAGFVGSALVPHLIQKGYRVKVIDLFWYGEEFFRPLLDRTPLELVRADIRDEAKLTQALAGSDALIHLACISNDPSFELNPQLGKSVNYDAFLGILRAVRKNRIPRFIYASSSSVYGLKDHPEVTEEEPCAPLTDYSKYKFLCEEELRSWAFNGCSWVIARPATVCGYAPRLRLDLTVNLLTAHALERKKITVFGGSQLRPNLNIRDMVAAYELLLTAPADLIARQTFNIGFENRSVAELAQLVRRVIGDPGIEIVTQSTEDLRSYQINSDRIRKALGFSPRWTIEEAVQSLCQAFRGGQIPNPLTDSCYYNIKRMQAMKEEELHVG